MFSPKRDETRPGYEMRKEHIAIGVMILLCLPILAIYVTFFAQAFVADGKLSLSNFRFLYTTIVLGQYTVPTMGPAFRNTVVFTLCVTACEVVVSLMAGYALSRMRFTGRNFLQKLLLILRLFPGVLLLIIVVLAVFSSLVWVVRANYEESPVWIVRTTLAMIVARPLCSLLQVGLLILTVLVWVQWPGILMVFGLSLPMFCTAWIVYSFGRLPGMDIHDRMEQSTGHARNQTS